MQANRRRDTQPERALRSELHRRGRRFRVDLPLTLSNVRVRPDIVFQRQRVAVFVDGCFWHNCPEHGSQPRANADYWASKLAANVRRDKRNNEALRDAGWIVIRLWEHVPPREAADAVEAALS